MVPCMNLLQALTCDMRINLRRGDVGMTEQQLHHTQIGTVVDQVCGKRMPEGVRRNRRADARGRGMALDQVKLHKVQHTAMPFVIGGQDAPGHLRWRTGRTS